MRDPLIYNCDLKTRKKKVEKKKLKIDLKMERLNFENLWFTKMKKNSTSPFTYCWKWFRNWTSFIRTSDSQIQQLQTFFGKLNLNCDCKLINILEIPSQTFRIQHCMYCLTVRSEVKIFLRLYPPENKRVRMKSCLQCLHSSLPLLSYVFSFEAQTLLVNRCICAF